MDWIDTALVVASFFGASIITDLSSYSLFGVDFGATMFTVGGFALSTAWVLLYGAILGTIITNDNASFGELGEDVQNLEQYYMIAAAATLLLPIVFIVLPSVQDFFQSADLWGLSFVAAVTVGQFALGWML
jgi:uncharacterized membrane protein (DUF485 family)